jgi:Rho termination factor, N-terminal domain
MRRLARILLAAGAIGALLAGLRKLFGDRTELLRSSVAPRQADPEADRDAGSPVSSRADASPNGASDLSREELYEKAKRLEIEGRSKMNKRELARAVAEREAGG